MPLGRLVALRQQAAASIGEGSAATGPAPTPAGTAQDEEKGQASRPGPRSGDPPGTTEQREQLRAYLADFCPELGDEAPLAASVTRALNTFAAAGVHPARWGDALYRARAITQEHTGQITKRSGTAAGARRKNKMPYFFSVLEQLVGLRPEPSPQPHPGDRAG